MWAARWTGSGAGRGDRQGSRSRSSTTDWRLRLPRTPGTSSPTLLKLNNTVRVEMRGTLKYYSIAEKSMFPAISSDRSTEDISNLQLKGSTAPAPGHTMSPSPRPSSVAEPGAAKPRAIVPAKPILKHRKPEPGSEECQPSVSQRYYGDGNWYTNPMDSSYFPQHSNSSYHHQVSIFSIYSFPGSFCLLHL